jgi:hypothetical protein
MKNRIKYFWLLLSGLVLFYWINKWHLSPDIPEAYRLEAQVVLLILMMLLSFPSGILWYLIFPLIILLATKLSIVIPISIEVPILWSGFVLIGYVQWFIYGPRLLKKYREWRQN